MHQEPSDPAATALDHKHKGKGDCGCGAHKLNTCECGHLVYVHGKGGCMFSMPQPSGAQHCPCPQAKPCIQTQIT